MACDDFEDYKVFISSLSAIPTVKRKKVLSSFLGQFGKVKKITFSKNSAVAEFELKESVQRSLEASGCKVAGSRICIQPYEPLPSERASSSHNNMYSELISILSRAENIECQLQCLVDVLQLTDDDERLRFWICDSLMKLLSPYFEQCKIYQFGSSINNFGDRKSDLDLFIDIQSNDERPSQRKFKVRLPFKGFGPEKLIHGPLSPEQLENVPLFDTVRLMGRIIGKNQREFCDIHSIPGKRCPLVKFYHMPSNISCDLSLNNRKALHNSRLLRLYSTNPVVRRMVMAIRVWAKSQDLVGDAFKISSYAMTLMALFFLMRRQPQLIPLVWDIPRCVEGVRVITEGECKILDIPYDARLTPSYNTESTADLLREFFRFYTYEVDWNNMVLFTSTASIIPKDAFQEDHPEFKDGIMNLMDPYDLSHNVLIRVNERLKLSFEEEVKRATELSNEWPYCPSYSNSEIWGFSTILEPNPNPSVDRTDTHSSKRKKHGAKNGKDNFTIRFAPNTSEMISSGKVWCESVRRLLVDILRLVFMVDINLEETSFTPGQKAATDNGEKDSGLSDSPVEVKMSDDKERTIACPPPPGISQFIPAPSPSKQSPDRLPAEKKCVGTLDTNLSKTAVTPDTDEPSSNRVVAQAKRSCSEAFLDRTSPASDCSRSQLTSDNGRTSFPNSDSSSQEQTSPNSVSKPAIKKVRLLNVDPSQDKNVCDTAAFALPGQPDRLKESDTVLISKSEKDCLINAVPVCPPLSSPQLTMADIKSVRESVYSCDGHHKVWVNRKVVKKAEAQRLTSFVGLELEREISKRVIQKLAKDGSKIPSQPSVEAGKESGSTLISTSTNTHMEIAVKDEFKSQEKKALLQSLKEMDSENEKGSYSTDVNKLSSSVHEKKSEFTFTCQIIETYISEAQFPQVQIAFQPHQDHVKIFREFFLPVQSMMKKYVSSLIVGSQLLNLK